MTTEAWWPFASLGMGVFAFFLCLMCWRWMGTSHVPKNLAEWYPELESAWALMVHKRRELGEAIAHAEQLREKLPEEYKTVMDHAIIMARASELALFTQARASGLVPTYWFSDDAVATVAPRLPLAAGRPEPPTDADPSPMTVDNVVNLPASAEHRREWIAGQLLKREASSS